MSRILLLGVAALAMLIQTAAGAERPVAKGHAKPETVVSPGEVTPTPEMWFYEQYQRQYEDPKNGVRAKAEFRADQRQRRLASSKWFGISNQRPKASTDPYDGDYSACWSSNNPQNPMQWNGFGHPLIVERSAGSETRIY